VQVKNTGPKLGNVADEHTRLVQEVLKTLRDTKVDAKSLQTSRMEFGENWDFSSNGRTRNGYFASTQISFKLQDLELYRALWLALAQAPSTSVQGVTYDHTQRIQYQNQTRLRAIEAAKEKAQALAKAAGAEIGEALLVEEDLLLDYASSGNSFNNLRTVSAEGSNQGESLAAGTIPIKTRVRATFRLKS
jgi:uncharacterized protein YggE